VTEQGDATLQVWTNLAAVPTQVVSLPMGRIAAALGDVNGDGVGDFGGWDECACSYPRFLTRTGGTFAALGTGAINDLSGRGVAGADFDGPPLRRERGVSGAAPWPPGR
jgi:hypothetical protein